MSSHSDQGADLDVLTRARAGDMQAHAAIYREHARSVYTLARRMLLHPELAEDVLQETFLEVIRNLHTFRAEASLRTWIRRIAVNRCLMHLRSAWHARGEHLNGGEAEVPAADQPADVDTALDLERALAALPAVSRAVVWLHDMEGYTHSEIGRLMGRTASFSKSQLARAHERMRNLMRSPQAEEPCESALKSS